MQKIISPGRFKPERVLENGEIIDARFVQGIDPFFRYSSADVAKFFTISLESVSKLCERKNAPKKLDPRHWQDIKEDRTYTSQEVANLFNCSRNLIYKLRFSGHFEQIRIRNTWRIPGWSLIDYIQENAAGVPSDNRLDFLSVGKLLRIPGWSLIDYIEKNCTTL